jgi:ParB family transcriptional regulator, chromosome partitioning protein
MRHDSHYVEQIASRSRSVGRTIPVASIFPNPEQPRVEFGDLSELTESIREKGVLEPLLVKPKPDGRFMIIAGERRWRASQLAGLTEVPCIEMDLDEKSIAEIALIENLQRKDLNIWEEADGLAALATKFGYTQDEIAKKISKSRTTVTELMTIAKLPPEIREKCAQAKISAKATLLEIARQFDEHAMFETVNRLVTGKSTSGNSGKGAVDANGPSRSKPFQYVSPDADFTLTLKFINGKPASEEAVLAALKVAFDAIRSKADGASAR